MYRFSTKRSQSGLQTAFLPFSALGSRFPSEGMALLQDSAQSFPVLDVSYHRPPPPFLQPGHASGGPDPRAQCHSLHPEQWGGFLQHQPDLLLPISALLPQVHPLAGMRAGEKQRPRGARDVGCLAPLITFSTCPSLVSPTGSIPAFGAPPTPLQGMTL